MSLKHNSMNSRLRQGKHAFSRTLGSLLDTSLLKSSGDKFAFTKKTRQVNRMKEFTETKHFTGLLNKKYII